MAIAQFKLDMFEGPLDLLLHLISKHKLNIYDIEISLLLKQYMEYIDNLGHENLDDAADFLEMAARLIYIKTCSLLPQDDEAEEMKKELEGRLIEYSQCKLAAQNLKNMYVGGDVFVRKPAKIPVDKTYRREHDASVLYDAFMGLSEKTRREKPLNAEIFEPLVSHKIVSLTTKIIYILKKLHIDGECDLSHIYDGMTSKSERVATFLAILELTKSGRICLNEDNTSISFNEESRKKKKSVEKEVSEMEITSEQNEDLSAFEIKGEEKEEDDISRIPEFVADDDVRTKPEYKHFSDYKPKPLNVQPQKAVKCCSTTVADRIEMKLEEEISEDVSYSVSDDENTEQLSDIAEKNDVTEETVSVEEEKSDDENISVYETQSLENETVTEKSVEDNITYSEAENISEQDIPEEIRLLLSLPHTEQTSVFKPNYWNRLRYYWGNTPVGDDIKGNSYRYGYRGKL